MSVYSVKGKGWRYDFTRKGTRHTEAWFKTKKEALRAEAQKKEELKQPTMEIPTDMGFLELVNLRLDHVKAYNSESHYKVYVYAARKWIERWGKLYCKEVTPRMVEQFVLERNKVSSHTANKEIRYLRAMFNFAKKKHLLDYNPVDGMEFLPVDKKVKYIPQAEDIKKVLQVADKETQDYLVTVCDTMARIGEVNRLCWDDVNLQERYVVLYTRKKKGGHLTPRKVPMTLQLFEVLSRRYEARDAGKPWVFWHRYFDRKNRAWKEGPYGYRKKIMKSLCRKAGVPFFQFHALRHAGASTLDNNNVPMGAIQRILGHENRTTTEIYLHSLGKTEVDAMKTLECVRNFSHTESHIEQKST